MRLEKDGDIYREVGETGAPGEWLKEYVPLHFSLLDIRAAEVVELDHGLDNANLERPDLRCRVSKQIRAIGHLPENQSIRVIGPDGTLGDRLKSVRVHIEVRQTWDEEQSSNPKLGRFPYRKGYMFHVPDDDRNMEEEWLGQLFIAPVVPPEAIDSIWRHIIEGRRFARLLLTVSLNLFQNRMESFMAEPYHRQEYCIEHNSMKHDVVFTGLGAEIAATTGSPRLEKDQVIL